VRFRHVVYVLHAFQKKSPRGKKTARTDIELIARRLSIARQDYEAGYGKSER
jgi:phage-related protein